MKKKGVMLIVLILFLTGCSVNANLTINDNMTVDEKIDIMYDNTLADNYDSPAQYASDYLDYYGTAISTKNYNYKIEEGNEKSYVKFDKSSKDICDSINYSLFSQYLYNKITCINEDDYFIVQSSGNQLISIPTGKKAFNVENVILKITLPISAVENNADEVDGNSYIWRYDETTISEKSIYLKFSKRSLEENKEIYDKTQANKNKRLKILTVLFGLIVLAGIIYLLNTLYKKYKENKLEY